MSCMSERSAHQILSIRDECTFLFLNFVINGFCNYSDNFLFEIFLFPILLPAVFLSKNL